MLVIVRCSVVSAHCAVVTLAVSARGSQVFIKVRDVYHAPLPFGLRSAHWVASLDETYEHPLAVSQVDHFVFTFLLSAITIVGSRRPQVRPVGQRTRRRPRP